MDEQPPPILELSAFDRHCGMEIVECDELTVRARVPLHRSITQPLGMAHGGVYATIAEGLASLGTNRGVAADGHVALGQSNSCSFVRPISDGSIHATAVVRHRGASTWIWDVDMRDDSDRLCAIGRVTIAVRPAPAPGGRQETHAQTP